MLLGPRDRRALEVLARCIRLATLEQLSAAYWREPQQAELVASRRIHALLQNGLLATRRVLAVRLRPLARPLAIWQPGAWVPDFSAIAWQLAKRWQQRPELFGVYYATSRTANVWGGKRLGRIPRSFQVAHDLGVAEMYFSLLRSDPQLSRRWIDEDRVAQFRQHEKIPDALLGQDVASPDCVLEFGGQYGKDRLWAFHDDCEERGLPYQIW